MGPGGTRGLRAGSARARDGMLPADARHRSMRAGRGGLAVPKGWRESGGRAAARFLHGDGSRARLRLWSRITSEGASMGIRRRTFLGAAAASLAAPGIGRAAGTSVLKFVPQADITILDPIWTTAYVTRNHGFMVFDTLYGIDSELRAPRRRWWRATSSRTDGRQWTLTLRDGLKWHDGEKVLAQRLRRLDQALGRARRVRRHGARLHRRDRRRRTTRPSTSA